MSSISSVAASPVLPVATPPAMPLRRAAGVMRINLESSEIEPCDAMRRAGEPASPVRNGSDAGTDVSGFELSIAQQRRLTNRLIGIEKFYPADAILMIKPAGRQPNDNLRFADGTNGRLSARRKGLKASLRRALIPGRRRREKRWIAAGRRVISDLQYLKARRPLPVDGAEKIRFDTWVQRRQITVERIRPLLGQIPRRLTEARYRQMLWTDVHRLAQRAHGRTTIRGWLGRLHGQRGRSGKLVDMLNRLFDIDAVASVKVPVKTEALASIKVPVETEAVASVKVAVKTEAIADTEVPVQIEALAQTEVPVEIEAVAQTEVPVEIEALAQTEVPVEFVTLVNTDASAEIETVANPAEAVQTDTPVTSAAPADIDANTIAVIGTSSDTDIQIENAAHVDAIADVQMEAQLDPATAIKSDVFVAVETAIDRGSALEFFDYINDYIDDHQTPFSTTEALIEAVLEQAAAVCAQLTSTADDVGALSVKTALQERESAALLRLSESPPAPIHVDQYTDRDQMYRDDHPRLDELLDGVRTLYQALKPTWEEGFSELPGTMSEHDLDAMMAACEKLVDDANQTLRLPAAFRNEIKSALLRLHSILIRYQAQCSSPVETPEAADTRMQFSDELMAILTPKIALARRKLAELSDLWQRCPSAPTLQEEAFTVSEKKCSLAQIAEEANALNQSRSIDLEIFDTWEALLDNLCAGSDRQSERLTCIFESAQLIENARLKVASPPVSVAEPKPSSTDPDKAVVLLPPEFATVSTESTASTDNTVDTPDTPAVRKTPQFYRARRKCINYELVLATVMEEGVIEPAPLAVDGMRLRRPPSSERWHAAHRPAGMPSVVLNVTAKAAPRAVSKAAQKTIPNPTRRTGSAVPRGASVSPVSRTKQPFAVRSTKTRSPQLIQPFRETLMSAGPQLGSLRSYPTSVRKVALAGIGA